MGRNKKVIGSRMWYTCLSTKKCAASDDSFRKYGELNGRDICKSPSFLGGSHGETEAEYTGKYSEESLPEENKASFWRRRVRGRTDH